MTKIMIAIFLTAAAVSAQAQITIQEHPQDQRSVLEASLPEQPAGPQKWLRPVNFLLNVLPLPIFSEGLGGAIEFQPIDSFAIWGGVQRDAETSDDIWGITRVKEQHTDQLAALRIYPFNEHLANFFVDAGYKWSRIDTTSSSIFLRGYIAPDSNYSAGLFGAAGVRFKFFRSRRVTMLTDVSVGYEPGYVKGEAYTLDSNPEAGSTVAHLHTNVGYGLFPKARAGLNF